MHMVLQPQAQLGSTGLCSVPCQQQPQEGPHTAAAFPLAPPLLHTTHTLCLPPPSFAGTENNNIERSQLDVCMGRSAVMTSYGCMGTSGVVTQHAKRPYKDAQDMLLCTPCLTRHIPNRESNARTELQWDEPYQLRTVCLVADPLNETELHACNVRCHTGCCCCCWVHVLPFY